MVAFRCTDNNNSSEAASSISLERNALSARLLMTEASMISPSSREKVSFKTVILPSTRMCSILTLVASLTVTDFSLS